MRGKSRVYKKPLLKLLLSVLLIGAIATAAPEIGRFVPTHKITEAVYCGACHPEQVRELNETTHLAHFAVASFEVAEYYGYEMSGEEAVSAACTMCHNYWDNFKWWGVSNYSLTHTETGDANHGLGSNDSYTMAFKDVVPWTFGLGNDSYTKSGINYTRVDKLWGQLSGISPGPANFRNFNTSSTTGCGSAEKGLCHIAQNASGMAAANKKAEFPGKDAGITVGSGNGVFFTHEMAYTTAQYAAKPVKLCGACHVFKLPPMNQEGHPLNKAEQQTLAYKFAVSRDNCRSCHGSDPAYVGVGAHDIHSGGAPAHGGVSGPCSDCHKNMQTDPMGCLLCHFDSEPTPEEKCAVCHIWGVPDWTQSFPNVSAFHWFHWANLSNPSHGNAGGDCSDCHGDLFTNSNCNKCHDPSYLNISAKPADWAHANVPCIRCHAHAGIPE